MVNLLFGYKLEKKKEEEPLVSFTPPSNDDGALVVAGGGSYGTVVDLDGTVRSEADMVTRYRQMTKQAEVYNAIDEIVNDAIVIEENKKTVEIVLDDVKVSVSVKKAIQDEFNNVLTLLDMNRYGYDIFRKWYVDGRLYYHVLIDEKKPDEGIKDLRYIDPRKIRKVREVKKVRTDNNNPYSPTVQKTVAEYYVYNDRGFAGKGGNAFGATPAVAGLRIAKDSIVYIPSGVTDETGTMVLGYLNMAIKPLNNLRSLEDAGLIYAISRAPARRIFNIEMGSLPKIKAEQALRDMMVKHKNRVSYDSGTGEIRDDRKFACYALETKIPLLDGRTLTLEQIIEEYKSGKNNWVYSCDPETGKFVPGPISWAGITKKDTSVVKVTFDNGESVICTPDHKFPVWGKGFIEAKDLVGESIIPGYRRMESVTHDSSLKYEQIYKNDTKKWEFTHREVSKWKDDNNLTDVMIYSDVYSTANKGVVHHKDFDNKNNNPGNLVKMNHADHLLYHHDIQAIRYTDEILSVLEVCAKSLFDTTKTIKYVNDSIDKHAWIAANSGNNPKNRNINELIFTYKDIQRISRYNGYKTWREYRSIFDHRLREPSGGLKRGTCDHGSIEWRKRISDSNKNKISFTKTWKIKNPDGDILVVENLSKFCRENDLNRNNIKGKFGSKKHYAEILVNHKAISVDWLDNKIDVGCLTIDLEEKYHSHHTYLLDAGVYTKNTMMEDYWFAMRDGKGVTVNQLEAGPNPSSIEILNYFQKKLFNALNVPLGRMESDGADFPGLATEITHEENKFARFIDRIRVRFGTLFTETLKQQLVLKGIVTVEEYEEFAKQIKYQWARDTYTEELKDIGIQTQRMNLIPLFQPIIGVYVSNFWFRKNILRQTEEDMEEEDERIADELINPQFAGGLLGGASDEGGGVTGGPDDEGDNFTSIPPKDKAEKKPNKEKPAKEVAKSGEK